MVTLEDRQIAQILADPRYAEVLPCVQTSNNEMKKVTKRCGRCNKKRQKARASIMQEARSCIARMGKQQKQMLKNLLGAKKVQVLVADGKKVRPVTF